MQRTGNPLDVAIDGEGFLVVQTPHGERYTRNGALQINAIGQLVTGEGYQVLGENGPIVLQPTDRDIAISAGRHDHGARRRQHHSRVQRGKLRLVALRQSADAAEGRRRALSRRRTASAAAATPTSRVVQGSIEKSNVNGVLEMTRMIEVTRTYTQIATVLQQQAICAAPRSSSWPKCRLNAVQET